MTALQAAMRAASVELLEDYAADASIKLQVYPGRPRSIAPPTAFVDRMGGTLDHSTRLTKQNPTAEVVVLHGIYDSMETANQRDAFMDGFVDWVEERFHAAGANTLIAVSDFEDEPNYIPEWMPPEQQRVYYGTRIRLEGYALIGS